MNNALSSIIITYITFIGPYIQCLKFQEQAQIIIQLKATGPNKCMEFENKARILTALTGKEKMHEHKVF